MNDHTQELLLKAPSSTVYDALSTPQGIQGWWTTDSQVGTAVGERITVRFGPTYKTMRVETLRPGSEVRWRVIDAHLHLPGVLQRADEWIGTTIQFVLEAESPDATRLRLTHYGLTPQVECHQICTEGWTQFLNSLKSYVETGTGNPFRGG